MKTHKDEDHAIRNAKAKKENIEAMASLYAIDSLDEYNGVDAYRIAEDLDMNIFTDWKILTDEDGEEYVEDLEGIDVYDIQEAVTERLNEYGLEITATGRKASHTGEWEITGFDWLLTYGGPGCRLIAETDENGTVTRAIVEYSGADSGDGDVGTVSEDACRLLSWFGECLAMS